ncbi:MAG TPA: pitrilysin family protein [Cyclobacteriaceae bacterium]|nr:pitrilysin family protein [Cyclobacteriaceae bacterium]
MLDRKTAPAFQKSNFFELIKPEKITLSNDISLVIVPGGEQEVIKIELIVKAAKWQETQAGVSYFTANLLQKGTASKNSFQISSELDQYGVHLEVNPGYDFTSITLYGLTKNMDRFFGLLFEIVTQPSFPELELQQAKDIYTQGLKINLEKTSYLASRQIRKTLFGFDHPYGRDAEIEDIEKIQREHLSAFHQHHYGNFEIICSGKITDTLLQGLKKTFAAVRVSSAANTMVARKEELISSTYLEKENTVQTSIRLGKRMISRIHPDYPALLLLNHILGGYFGSRLMKNIREEKGLTYGIYSSMTALLHDGFISIGADVNKENRELTIIEIKKELNNLRAQKVGVTELETAKNHFIGSLQAEITTPFAHADKIKNMLLYSLPDDYYQSLLIKIDSVNDSTLQGTAEKYFNEDSFSVVAVG